MPNNDVLTNNNILLAAVNRILGTIAAAPVNSENGFNNANVALALNAILNTSEMVQAEDWAFNSFYNFTFTPDKDTKKIVYRDEILRLHLRDRPIINRDGYFFDISNNTFIFDKPLVVDEVVFKFAFEELPLPIRTYITAKASREFQVGNIGSDRVEAYLQEQELRARIAARDWDITEGAYNMFMNKSVFLQNLRR